MTDALPKLRRRLSLGPALIAALVLAALTFVATALLRLPLSWVLLSLGGAGIFWAYRQLGRVQKVAA